VKTSIKIIILLLLALPLKSQIDLNSAFKYLESGKLDKSIQEFEKNIKSDYKLPDGSIILDSICRYYNDNPNKYEVNYVLAILCKKMNFDYDSYLFFEDMIKLSSERKYIEKSCKIMKTMKIGENEINSCRFIKEYLNKVKKVTEYLFDDNIDNDKKMNKMENAVSIFDYKKYDLGKDNIKYRKFKKENSVKKRTGVDELFTFWDVDIKMRSGIDHVKYLSRYKNCDFNRFIPIKRISFQDGFVRLDIGDFSYSIIKKDSYFLVMAPDMKLKKEDSNSFVRFK
jgi:hypothetical protein